MRDGAIIARKVKLVNIIDFLGNVSINEDNSNTECVNISDEVDDIGGTLNNKNTSSIPSIINEDTEDKVTAANETTVDVEATEVNEIEVTETNETNKATEATEVSSCNVPSDSTIKYEI